MCTNVPHSCTNVQLCLGGRANQAEIAPRADLGGGTGFEVLAEDALADLEHHSLDPLQVIGRAAHRHLLVRENVPGAPGAPLGAPSLTGRQPVDRELDVGLEFARSL